MHPYLNDGKCIAFAHRGGGLEAPENTLDAFEYAVDLGFRYVETDVQATSDGVIVIFHDDTMERLTGQPGVISDYTWDELQKFSVLGAGPIPRLEEAVAAWPDLNLNIDAKTDHVVVPLCNWARSANLAQLCLASDKDKRIAHIRKELGRDLCTVAATGEAARFLLPALVGLKPGPMAANCLQLPTKAFGLPTITRATLGRAREAGLPIHVWTIDDAGEMAQLAEKRVGGIMTDRPALLKSVMEPLQLW